MKNTTLRALLKNKEASSIISHLDKKGGMSALGPVVQLARHLKDIGYLVGEEFHLLLVNPYPLTGFDRFKWFGMLGPLLGLKTKVTVHVVGMKEFKEVNSPYQKALGLVPAISIKESKEVPTRIDAVNYDALMLSHVDTDDALIKAIKTADYKTSLALYWSETDWAINSELARTHGIDLSDPEYSEYSVGSGVENGSAWCHFSSSIVSLDKTTEIDKNQRIRAEWLQAMFSHSANLGYTNPILLPGSPIRDMKLNNKVVNSFIYVIDNLVFNTENGFLYSFKNRDVSLIGELHEFAKKPNDDATFIDRIIWAYELKCLFFLRANEKEEINERVKKTLVRYSEISSNEVQNLFMGLVYEIENELDSAAIHYGAARIKYPADAACRIAGVYNKQDKAEKAIELYEIAAHEGSATSGYNAHVLSHSSNYQSHGINDHIRLLEKPAKMGLEPAQASLGELLYQVGDIKGSEEWLRSSAESGNVDSAHNRIIILEKMLSDGQTTKFEIKKAQKFLRQLEKEHYRRSSAEFRK